jgi:excinuclease ABC subunit B
MTILPSLLLFAIAYLKPKNLFCQATIDEKLSSCYYTLTTRTKKLLFLYITAPPLPSEGYFWGFFGILLIFMMANKFKLKSKFKPAGDQPKAAEGLVSGLEKKYPHQTLLGVTGSGKTFTVANVIAKINKPTLVIAHNKTLAAQLCNEFREFFPENAVEYFVSYYDYYQPEAYLPRTDTYIEKEAMINDEIDRLRHVIIVASVSCIYGLGAPETYEKTVLHLAKDQTIVRADLLNQLITMQFNRTNSDLKRGGFRLHGETLEIMPVNQEVIYRVESSAQKINKIFTIDPVTRKIKDEPTDIWIFPAKHFVTLGPERERAFKTIENELKDRLEYFNKNGKLREVERLERRLIMI